MNAHAAHITLPRHIEYLTQTTRIYFTNTNDVRCSYAMRKTVESRIRYRALLTVIVYSSTPRVTSICAVTCRPSVLWRSWTVRKTRRNENQILPFSSDAIDKVAVETSTEIIDSDTTCGNTKWFSCFDKPILAASFSSVVRTWLTFKHDISAGRNCEAIVVGTVFGWF